jgi:hypothetical protein
MIVSTNIQHGNIGIIASEGVYSGLMTFIAPFYWLWTILPVEHPPFYTMLASRDVFLGPPMSFLFALKLPIFLFDLLTGILVAKLVQAQSSNAGAKGFLAWYLNPYNWVWLYWYSTYDIIPTAIVTLAILLAIKGRWLQCGLCLSFAGLLRLYPFLIFPFFLLYASRVSRRSILKFAAGFLAPVVSALLVMVVMIGSLNSLIMILLNTPLRQDWVLVFYGFPISNASISLTPFLLGVQLYLIMIWNRNGSSMTNVALVSILLIFVGSYHHGYHFLWVSPFLSAYSDLDRKSMPLFVLTYFVAFFSPITYEGGVLPVFNSYYRDSLLALGEAITSGAFVACKLAYVVLVNGKAISRKSFGSLPNVSHSTTKPVGPSLPKFHGA